VKPLDSGSIGPGRSASWTGYGATLKTDDKSIAYKDGWILKKPQEHYTPINALIGACYAISRETFNKLGGWIKTRQWGYNEQALSMKAWFCGIPLFVDRDTVICHQFKRKFKYPCSKSGSQINRWHVHAVLFDPSTFETYWRPRFTEAFGPKVTKKAEALLAEEDIQQEIKDFQAKKVHTDAEFFIWAPKLK